MVTDRLTEFSRAQRILAFAWLTLFGVLVLGAIAITLFGKPRQTVVVMNVPRQARAQTRTAAKPQPAKVAALPATAPVPVPTPPPLAPPQKLTAPRYAGRALIADPALIENTPEGPLPRIANDGTTPMRAYAPPASNDGRPRIAIVIAGLGISAKATQGAIDGLPAGVTLAFAPYAADVQQWAAKARGAGHEVLLEIPMEPYDFPDSDPGPHTLRSGTADDANTERLVWSLTRFSGYAGVTNLLGGRFLADANSLEPMMTYLARRGLLFYDNGSTTHSAGPDVAARTGAVFVQADSTIDKIETAMEIDRRLSGLESVARARGAASGAGFLYPITVDRVRSWAAGLSGRGFVLVPASAIVSASK